MKKILISMAALSLIGTAFAQDFDDFGSYEETAEPSVTINGEAGFKARGWMGYTEDGQWRDMYDDVKDIQNTTMAASAYGKVEFNYSAESSDVDVKFKVDSATVKEYPEDILEEATARGFFGNWVISAGKMKSVWGKGDKLHVIDNFNANNYTDFIFPDYLERRIAEPMLSIAYSVPTAANIRIEGIFTPMMTADRLASSGILMPAAQKNLTDLVTGILATEGNAAFTSAMTDKNGAPAVKAVMDLASFSTDDLFDDNLKTLKYAQAGARMTGTLGSIDWGFSYYYGHNKQPSANLEKYVDYVATGTIREKINQMSAASLIPYTLEQIEAMDPSLKEKSVARPTLAYDQVQTFGFEAAFVLWKFNTRWEVAYNLTEDTAGDNPWVKNNSIGWVAGFDMDLPIHNLNINVQEQGSYILNNDKIGDANLTYLKGTPLEQKISLKEHDVDYKSNDKYCNNKLVINISDKWLHEKLTTECTTIYGIENKEWCVQPKIEYNAADGLFLTLSGAYLSCNEKDGEFWNFTADSKDNKKCFAQIAVKYCF